MIYVYLAVVIILLITLKPKYLGIFRFLSISNSISESMIMNLRYSVVIALGIWLIARRYGFIQEPYENAATSFAASQNILAGNNTSAPDTFQYSTAALDAVGKEKLCMPDSGLNSVQRNIICESGSPNVAGLMSSPAAFDPSQFLLSPNTTGLGESPVYYEPGTVQYTGMGYVPSYEQAAYNDDFKFKEKPTPIENSFASNGGFCNDSSMMGNIETKCNSLSKEVCATTSCCVLVGGEKCVEGGVSGPKRKSIYSDTTIKNRDAYYYQGKCYGNCM